MKKSPQPCKKKQPISSKSCLRRSKEWRCTCRCKAVGLRSSQQQAQNSDKPNGSDIRQLYARQKALRRKFKMNLVKHCATLFQRWAWTPQAFGATKKCGQPHELYSPSNYSHPASQEKTTVFKPSVFKELPWGVKGKVLAGRFRHLYVGPFRA